MKASNQKVNKAWQMITKQQSRLFLKLFLHIVYTSIDTVLDVRDHRLDLDGSCSYCYQCDWRMNSG